MNFKSLILGSASALMVATGAQAADLPAEPVDYVRVCDAYGSGFYYLPGTDTCLRVGGRIRADYRYIDADGLGDVSRDFVAGGAPSTIAGFSNADNDNDLDFRARAYWYLDSRSQTDYGLLRTYLSGYFTVTDNGGTSPNLEAGFIQWGGLTAGRTTTFFYPTWGGTYANSSEFATPDLYEEVNLLAYTFDLGNGISATLAAEDRNDLNPGEAPVGVVNINVNQSWGNFSLGGAVGDSSDSATINSFTLNGNDATNGGIGAAGVAVAEQTVALDDTGWAINAGVEVNVPVAGANDRFGISVLYMENLPEYGVDQDYVSANSLTNVGLGLAAATALSSIGVQAGANNIDSFTTSIEDLSVFHIGAGFLHFFSPELSLGISGTYTHTEVDARFVGVSAAPATFTGAGTVEVDSYSLAATMNWTPVSGLVVSGEAYYQNSDLDGVADVDAFGGLFRVQRTF